MLRRALRWLAARREADDTDGDDEGFLPSVLDASVRHAHGDSKPEGERAIAEVQAQARELERQREE
jgi:hypothetical protein